MAKIFVTPDCMNEWNKYKDYLSTLFSLSLRSCAVIVEDGCLTARCAFWVCYMPGLFYSRGFLKSSEIQAGKIKTYTGTSPPLFSKKAMPWGKKWPVQMNLPFFDVKAYVPGGGGPESGRKKFEKCLPAVPVQKFTFPVQGLFLQNWT